MYTLRTIAENRVEQNISIGSSYSYISKMNTPDVFKEVIRVHHLEDVKSPIIGLVTSGSSCYPVYEDQFTYIMTESGQTFSKLN